MTNAIWQIKNKLAKSSLRKTIIGIQGGKGSFNEQAILFYLKSNPIQSVEIRYLFTSENVLKNLSVGNIDLGLMAHHNSLGGIVEETATAQKKYPSETITSVTIPICHFLMKLNGSKNKNIDTIMAHPQVFAQCKETLRRRYPNLKLISGAGELIDTARAAEALANSNLPPNIAILGPENLSTMYHLRVVAKNLQDSKNNFTTFILVKRSKLP